MIRQILVLLLVVQSFQLFAQNQYYYLTVSCANKDCGPSFETGVYKYYSGVIYGEPTQSKKSEFLRVLRSEYPSYAGFSDVRSSIVFDSWAEAFAARRKDIAILIAEGWNIYSVKGMGKTYGKMHDPDGDQFVYQWNTCDNCSNGDGTGNKTLFISKGITLVRCIDYKSNSHKYSYGAFFYQSLIDYPDFDDLPRNPYISNCYSSLDEAKSKREKFIQEYQNSGYTIRYVDVGHLLYGEFPFSKTPNTENNPVNLALSKSNSSSRSGTSRNNNSKSNYSGNKLTSYQVQQLTLQNQIWLQEQYWKQRAKDDKMERLKKARARKKAEKLRAEREENIALRQLEKEKEEERVRVETEKKLHAEKLRKTDFLKKAEFLIPYILERDFPGYYKAVTRSNIDINPIELILAFDELDGPWQSWIEYLMAKGYSQGNYIPHVTLDDISEIEDQMKDYDYKSKFWEFEDKLNWVSFRGESIKLDNSMRIENGQIVARLRYGDQQVVNVDSKLWFSTDYGPFGGKERWEQAIDNCEKHFWKLPSVQDWHIFGKTYGEISHPFYDINLRHKNGEKKVPEQLKKIPQDLQPFNVFADADQDSVIQYWTSSVDKYERPIAVVFKRRWETDGYRVHMYFKSVDFDERYCIRCINESYERYVYLVQILNKGIGWGNYTQSDFIPYEELMDRSIDFEASYSSGKIFVNGIYLDNYISGVVKLGQIKAGSELTYYPTGVHLERLNDSSPGKYIVQIGLNNSRINADFKPNWDNDNLKEFFPSLFREYLLGVYRELHMIGDTVVIKEKNRNDDDQLFAGLVQKWDEKNWSVKVIRGAEDLPKKEIKALKRNIQIIGNNFQPIAQDPGFEVQEINSELTSRDVNFGVFSGEWQSGFLTYDSDDPEYSFDGWEKYSRLTVMYAILDFLQKNEGKPPGYDYENLSFEERVGLVNEIIDNSFVVKRGVFRGEPKQHNRYTTEQMRWLAVLAYDKTKIAEIFSQYGNVLQVESTRDSTQDEFIITSTPGAPKPISTVDEQLESFIVKDGHMEFTLIAHPPWPIKYMGSVPESINVIDRSVSCSTLLECHILEFSYFLMHYEAGPIVIDSEKLESESELFQKFILSEAVQKNRNIKLIGSKKDLNRDGKKYLKATVPTFEKAMQTKRNDPDLESQFTQIYLVDQSSDYGIFYSGSGALIQLSELEEWELEKVYNASVLLAVGSFLSTYDGKPESFDYDKLTFNQMLELTGQILDNIFIVSRLHDKESIDDEIFSWRLSFGYNKDTITGILEQFD